MPRPRERHRPRALALRFTLGRPRAHPPRPVLVIAVADDQRKRRPQRPAVAKTGEHLDLVLLQLLAGTAAVALLAAAEVGVNRAAVEDEAGGRPTTLVEAAREAGCEVVDGLEALVRQGAASFELWTGVPAPVDVMRAAVRSG